MIIVQLFLAYIVVDAGSGLYHLATDSGWNFKSQVEGFRRHHDSPESLGLDWLPACAAVPIALFGYVCFPWFFGFSGILLAVIQVPHYFIHHRGQKPWAIRILQEFGMVVSDRRHDIHHLHPNDKNFCILSGWNDWWINALSRAVARKLS